MKKTFIIAEIAQAHDGSLGIAHSYIDALSRVGVDAVKFQTHIADAESSKHEPFRINFSYKNETRYEYWKRIEFSFEEWVGLKEHCENVGLEFLSTPFSIKALHMLEKIKVKKYKISSGDIENYLMFEALKLIKKPVILSTGLADDTLVKQAFNYLSESINDISILQCTTEYPSPPKNWGLQYINNLKEAYKCKIGLSDHSGEIYSSLAAVALGADIIEFHAVFDKQSFGPDSSSSLDFSQIKQLTTGIRLIDESLNSNYRKVDSVSKKELRKIFGKSLAINRSIDKGTKLEFNMLETKKPHGMGIDPKNFLDYIDRTVNQNLQEGDFIEENHFN